MADGGCHERRQRHAVPNDDCAIDHFLWSLLSPSEAGLVVTARETSNAQPRPGMRRRQPQGTTKGQTEKIMAARAMNDDIEGTAKPREVPLDGRAREDLLANQYA